MINLNGKMGAIWKFQLQTIPTIQEIEMPDGAAILTVQTQNECPCIWALVIPDNPNVKRTFVVYATGQSIPAEHRTRKYIDTYQLNEGSLVLHVFELVNN